jgi:hypothetical protein
VDYIEMRFMRGQCKYDLEGSANTAKDVSFVAWGGVCMQLLLLVPAAVILAMSPRMTPGLPPVVVSLLQLLTYYNAFLIILNLVPINPLDGYHAWRIVRRANPRRVRKQKRSAKRRASGGVIEFRKKRGLRVRPRRDASPAPVTDISDYLRPEGETQDETEARDTGEDE